MIGRSQKGPVRPPGQNSPRFMIPRKQVKYIDFNLFYIFQKIFLMAMMFFINKLHCENALILLLILVKVSL